MKIFISYSRSDLSIALRIKNALHNPKFDFWIDVFSVPAGKDWGDVIWEALDTSQVMLLVISPRSIKSEQVSAEWKYFLRTKKPIIPLIIEKVSENDVHYLISGLQYIDFLDVEAFDTSISQLNRELASKLVQIEKTVNLREKAPHELPSSLTKQTGALNPDVVRQIEEKQLRFDAQTKLVLSLPDDSSNTFSVPMSDKMRMILGRSSDDFMVDIDLSRFEAEKYGVSRKHAELSIEDESLYIKDLKSTNFTYVNKTKLRPYEKRMLGNGDALQLGALLLLVRFSRLKN